MALDVLEEIQEQSCHGDLPQATSARHVAEESNTSLQQVDTFLIEAVNSRNRITVLRLEQEIEKFAQNANLNDYYLKPIQSSYERLAAHRIAQHYGLQSMVVSASSPKVLRIYLVKTLESRLPSVRLADIPPDNTLSDKPVPLPEEKFAIKQRVNKGLNADCCNGSADTGKIPSKTMEEREEEYDKARARIFNSRDVSSTMHGEAGAADGHDSLKTLETSPSSRSPTSPSGEGKSQFLGSNRVAIFRDREKDMKDPDYDRSLKRYLLTSDPVMSSIFPSLPRIYTPINVYDNYAQVDGPWGSQLHTDYSQYVTAMHFRAPWIEPCYPDPSYVHYAQGHSDPYGQCQRFPSQSAHYSHVKEAFPYSFQHGLQSTMSLSALGR